MALTRKQRRALRRKARLAYRIRKNGGRYGYRIVTAADRAGIPVSLACALVEQESDFRNIFGCDLGNRSSAPWCRQDVTRERVQDLLHYVAHGGPSNGVGLTQLTSIGFIQRAEAMGGAHLPKHQLSVGFAILEALIRRYGERQGIGAYNGGAGNPQWGYADQVLSRKARWKRVLT